MPNVDTIAPPNPRHIRALYWLWRYPDARKHTALAECDDPRITYAAALIRSGHAAMVAAAEADPDIADLFNVIAAMPDPHPRTLARLLESASAEELADSLFIAADPGLGTWPSAPEHTCALGQSDATVITINPTARRLTASAMVNPEWRRDTAHGGRCDACYHDRVLRAARGVAWEADRHLLTWVVLPAAPRGADNQPLGRWTGRMHDARRRGGDAVRYLALPQPDRTTVIISTAAEGEPVGRDRANIYGLLWRWLETPDGKRQSTSRDGWGGPWQGTQGDGRNRAQTRARHAEQKEQHAGHCLHCDADLPPGRVYCDAECRAAYGEAQRKAAGVVQRWTARPVAEVARALGKRSVRAEQSTASMSIDPAVAVARLHLAGITTYGVHEDADARARYAGWFASAMLSIVDVDAAEADAVAAEAVAGDNKHSDRKEECLLSPARRTAHPPRRPAKRAERPPSGATSWAQLRRGRQQ